jgi:PAS domain S-box-containing protein
MNPVAESQIDARLAEEKLRLEKQKLDKIAASVPGVICSFHLSLTGHVSMPYASPSAKEVYGLDPMEFSTDMTPVFSRILPEDIEHVNATIALSAQNMDIWKDEFRYQHPTKGVIWIEGHSMPVPEPDGSITWHGFIADITERKKAEVDLKRNEHILRLFVEHTPAAIAMFDREMRYIITSRRYISDYRLAEQDLTGRSHYEVFPEMDEARKEIHSRCLTGEVVKCEEDPLPRMDGIMDWVRYELRPWYETEGCIGGVIFFSEVITERKQAEITLRDSEKKYRDLINNMNDTIFVIDYDTSILDVNNTATTVLGYSREELLSMKISDIDSNLTPEQIQQLAISMPIDKVQLFETVHRAKNGKTIPVEVSSSLVAYDGKTVIMSISRDITERKKAEEELRNAKEQAEESDRLKSAFLSNMSHEIRTPMNAILGFADLLRKPNLSEANRTGFIDIINQSGERMLNTINDLIEISSIEAGAVTVMEMETNLNELLHFLYSFFEIQSQQKGLHLFCNAPLPDEMALVITDKNKLDRVLINLIGNAMKFTQIGSIEFGYKPRGKLLEFYVADTGIGIPAPRLDAIFERFVQADISITRPYEGSGLGLTISKEYVEMLGGTLWVESKEGIGSTFRFTIPWKMNGGTKPEVLPVIHQSIDHSLKERTVLITEDDEINYFYLKSILDPLCKSVLRATNGKEAVHCCLTDSSISIILMDVKMREMDGYEATRQIREFNHEVIIVAQTAQALKGEQEKALLAGCDDYISKPFNADKLIGLLAKNIKRKNGKLMQ